MNLIDLDRDIHMLIAGRLSWLYRHIYRRVCRYLHRLLNERPSILSLGMLPSYASRTYGATRPEWVLHITPSDGYYGGITGYHNNDDIEAAYLALWLMPNIGRDALISAGYCNYSILTYITRYDDPELFWAVRDVLRRYGDVWVTTGSIGPRLMQSMLSRPDRDSIIHDYVRDINNNATAYMWPDAYMMVCRAHHNDIIDPRETLYRPMLRAPREVLLELIRLVGYPTNSSDICALVHRGIWPTVYTEEIIHICSLDQIAVHIAQHRADISGVIVNRPDIYEYALRFDILAHPMTALKCALYSDSLELLLLIHDNELVPPDAIYEEYTVIYHDIYINAPGAIHWWICKRFQIPRKPILHEPSDLITVYIGTILQTSIDHLWLRKQIPPSPVRKYTLPYAVASIHAALGDSRTDLLYGRDPRFVANSTVSIMLGYHSSNVDHVLCGYLGSRAYSPILAILENIGLPFDQYRAYLARH